MTPEEKKEWRRKVYSVDEFYARYPEEKPDTVVASSGGTVASFELPAGNLDSTGEPEGE